MSFDTIAVLSLRYRLSYHPVKFSVCRWSLLFPPPLAPETSFFTITPEIKTIPIYALSYPHHLGKTMVTEACTGALYLTAEHEECREMIRSMKTVWSLVSHSRGSHCREDVQ